MKKVYRITLICSIMACVVVGFSGCGNKKTGDATVKKEKVAIETTSESVTEKVDEQTNYKDEIDTRIETLKVAVEDNKMDLERGVVPEDMIANIKERNKKIEKVIKKYEEILSEKDLDYQIIAKQLDQELEKLYEEINS
ncbi:MAG: hypothetical protein K6G85_08750 [Eubacterium sp.]|nr:hypothetical protein [Eubacterium sp.]